MLLSTMLGNEAALPRGAESMTVSGITADSRQVTPGMLFVALAGSKTDGARFVADAVARGAVAILAASDAVIAAPDSVPVLRAADPRRALALMAARLYPRQPAVTVAVTGTSGKTSVAEFTRQIFTHLGHRAASLGTLGVIGPAGAAYGSLTTPDPVTIHQTLDRLAGDGVTHLALEASSHGLDQHRLDGVRLTAAAFTNLSRDHLDYHPTMADYLSAKLGLFTRLLSPDGTAVVFVDDGYDLGCDGPCKSVLTACAARGLRTLTVGHGTGDLCSHMVDQTPALAQPIEVTFEGRRYTTRLPVLGSYQRDNALVAAGLAIAAGCDPAAVFDAFVSLRGVPGRLELVGHARGAPVLVDYAHKPDGLENVLGELRQQAPPPGRVICVFGCGGDRDQGKRPMMGEIAARRADVVIVTDDNPRSENPAAIRAAILATAPGAIEIGDRAAAIHHAVALARAGDVVLIAGKGHETGQIVGGAVLPFSDQDVARAAIAEVEARG